MTRGFDAMQVRITPGPLVLEASAGTGKTFTMVQLAVRILMQHTDVASRGPRHLLLVTFTKTATAELKERLRVALRAVDAIARGTREPKPAEAWITAMLDDLGDGAADRARALVTQLDELSVTTIHGFCVGVLEEFPQECGVRGELVFREDDSELVSDVLEDLLRARTWACPWTAAGVIVAGWTRDTLTKPLAALRRYGTAQVKPSPDLEALAALQEQVRRFGLAWDRAAFAAQLEATLWKDKALLGLPEVRTSALTMLDALAAGDPAGMAVLEHFTLKALEDAVKRRAKAEKASHDALRDHPVSVALREVLAQRDLWLAHLRVDLVLDAMRRIPLRKQALGIATFDDQIRLVRDALAHATGGTRLAEALHQRFDAVLVDEAQDTDPAQWTIFRQAFASRPLLIVGDPKQAIYGWRGADLEAYLSARDEAGPERTLQLDRNWRSTPTLLGALEQLYTRMPEPFAVPASRMDFIPVGAGPAAPILHDPGEQASLVWQVVAEPGKIEQVRGEVRGAMVAEIRRLIREAELADAQGGRRRVQAGDIAVLVRRHAEAHDIQQALQAAGINAVVSGSGDVTASEAWQEVRTVVEAIAAPHRPAALRAAAATHLAGVSLEQVAAWALDPTDDEAVAWEQRLVKSHDEAQGRGVSVAVAMLLAEWDSVTRIAARADGERWLTDLRHVLELVREAATEHEGDPLQVAQWMREWPAASSDARERKQLRLESDADAVQVRTMHVAKGLQYPIVFVPACWEGAKDDDKADPMMVRGEAGWEAVFTHAPSRHLVEQEADGIALQEALRLCYVALTRAQSRCYVALGCGASQRDRGALGWLLRPEQDAEKAVEELPAWCAAVEVLARQSNGTMAVVPVTTTLAYSPAPPELPAVALAPRIDPSRPMRTWTTTSYTQLVDRVEAERDVADPGMRVDRTVRTPLDLLPPGATSGIAVHALFERLDFAAGADAIRAAAGAILLEFGLVQRLSADDRVALVEAVVAMTRDTLEAPIPGLDVALRDVPVERTLREWRFTLDVERATITAIADRLRGRGGGWPVYADEVARMPPHDLEGFLTGVIDLALEHDGRWLIVDWKTNHLGHAPDAYAPGAIFAEMQRHHYVLQHELYRVALGRFLAARGRAGAPIDVAYAFVRGRAWYVDRG